METGQKSNGALIGLIVIVIILIVGGLYIWQNSMKNRDALEGMNKTANTNTGIDAGAQIEADLENMDLDSLDQGI